MTEQKTARMLARWLDQVISPAVPKGTRAVAHGGTLLALRGIKETTKDVDLAFLDRHAFDQVRGALERAKYRVTMDLAPLPGESLLRFENPSEDVDVVDVRHPTWNSWRMAGAALRGCTRDLRQNVELLLPDAETAFVFKSYPCRPSDLSDLAAILRKLGVAGLHWAKIRRIVLEQESYWKDQKDYSEEMLVGQLRGRMVASWSALAKAGHSPPDAELEWATERWSRLGLPSRSPEELLELVRGDENEWPLFLSRHERTIRAALAAAVER